MFEFINNCFRKVSIGNIYSLDTRVTQARFYRSQEEERSEKYQYSNVLVKYLNVLMNIDTLTDVFEYINVLLYYIT